MKRLNRSALVVALLLFAACSQQSARPPARLSGTRTLAVVNDFVFLTSTDRSELRVIEGATQDFVRAPNPLEPLAVPVLDTPDAIEADVGVTNGKQSAGQFVYAWRHGGSQISVVGADPSSLREERRIDEGDEPITAVAARAQASEGEPSTLYEALYSVNPSGFRSGGLYKRLIPKDPNVKVPPELITSFDNEAITAIVVLPGDNQLVVATRSTLSGGTDGNVWWLDTTAPANRVSLKPACTGTPDSCGGFSAPVRELRLDPRLFVDGKLVVWGLLDETTCGDASCGGIEAVELSFAGATPTAARAKDGNNLPMRKIVSTGGIFTSLDLSIGGTVRRPDAPGEEPFQFALMGLAATGNGDIIVFFAEDKHAADANLNPPDYGQSTRRPEGRPGPLLNGPVDIALGDGAARTETVEIVFEGALTSVQTGPFTVPAELSAADVGTDDRVVYEKPECPELRIIKQPDGSFTTDPASAGTGCDKWVIRAGKDSALGAYVVRGDASGYMGRAAEERPFEFPKATDLATRQSRYFQSTEDAVDGKPQLKFTLNKRATDIARDDAYLLDVRSNFRPLSLVVNTNAPEFQALFVPGSAVRSSTRDRTYISYPAANQILEMSTGEFNTQNSSHLVTNTYR